MLYENMQQKNFLLLCGMIGIISFVRKNAEQDEEDM